MPPRPPLINTCRIVVPWTGPNGTKAANIMHCLMGPGWTPSPSNLQLLAQNVHNSFNSSLLTAQVGGSWTQGVIACYDNGGTTENQGSFAATLGGAAAGNTLPPNCCTVVSWTIPAHYRGGHPRTYLPGTPESGLTSVGSNQLASSLRTSLATAWGSFLTAFNAALIGTVTEQLISLAYTRGGVALSSPSWYPITGGTIHGRLDSQRRRLGKEAAFM